MKTIKQLEKEIEEVKNTQNIQHTLKFDDWKVWSDKKSELKETKAKLETLKEVLKEIDYEIGFLGDVINGTRKGGLASKAVSKVTFIIKRRMEELKAKLIGK